MARVWVRLLTLLVIALSGCQNTADQQATKLGGGPETIISGSVSIPLAVSLSAASLRAHNISSGYRPVENASVAVILLDANGGITARLSARTGPDGSYRVPVPLRAEDIIGKTTYACLVTIGVDLQMSLLTPLTGSVAGNADVHPGTTLLTYAEVGALANAGDIAATYRDFIQGANSSLAHTLAQVNLQSLDLAERQKHLADLLSQTPALRDISSSSTLTGAMGNGALVLKTGLANALTAAGARGASLNSALIFRALSELFKQAEDLVVLNPLADRTNLSAVLSAAGKALLADIDRIILLSGQIPASPTPTSAPTVPSASPSPVPSAVSGVSGASGISGGNGQAAGGGGSGL